MPQSTAAAPPIRRPTYREGQFLRVEELQTERQSRSDALARHEQNVHAPGIAFGLEVTIAALLTGIEIQPGLAVDGAGRYLVLEQPLTASLTDGEDVTVSIVWRQGTSQIELSDTPPPAPADRTADAWPVVLGRAELTKGTVTVHSDVREDLQLQAAALSDPAGGSRVLLGGQSGHHTQVLGVQLTDDKGALANVSTVNADGTGRVDIDISVAGEVQVGGRVRLHAPAPAPQAAVPWSLYRATLTRPDKTVAEQLRLEVGEVKSGVNPGAVELLVATGGKGAAQDLLRVDGVTTVTIGGPLTVEGFSTVTGFPGPLPAGTTLSSLAAQEAQLLAVAQVLLNQLTNSDLQAALHAGPAVSGGTAVTYTLRLTSSATTAVTAVAVYETVVNLTTNALASSQFIAQGIDLPAASSHDVARTVTLGPHPTSASVAIMAVGVGQDGQPRIGTLQFHAST
jgi:hypothetical protein